MIRRVIEIDTEKCNGCGLCAKACHEQAIGIVNGKAVLLKDDYCDGLGDCLPSCPMQAIRFVEREAAPYDEAAVQARKAAAQTPPAGGCPGARMRQMQTAPAPAGGEMPSQLRNWPVQIKLAPTRAPYFDGAELLIAADCTAFSYGSFHAEFLRGRVALIGCPKLDGVDYAEKLAEILRANAIRSVTVARMEVPCCGGLENAVRRALAQSGKEIPMQVRVISIDGALL